MSIADYLEIDVRRWPTASCRGMSADLFYPTTGQRTLQAVAVCATCPVKAECLDYALEHHERFGVWGGMSERSRRRVMTARRKEMTDEQRAAAARRQRLAAQARRAA